MKLTLLLRSSILVAAVAATNSAFADYFSYNGTTVGAPTYDRAFADGSALSPNGAAVRYDATTFDVNVAGTYVFSSLSTLPQTRDNFIFLYSTFDPNDALSGYIEGNDDFTDFGTAAFTAELTPGTYTYVTTGFDSSEFGAFSNSILGPGTISSVPEPATLAALGIGAAAMLRRRGAKA